MPGDRGADGEFLGACARPTPGGALPAFTWKLEAQLIAGAPQAVAGEVRLEDQAASYPGTPKLTVPLSK